MCVCVCGVQSVLRLIIPFSIRSIQRYMPEQRPVLYILINIFFLNSELQSGTKALKSVVKAGAHLKTLAD